MLVVPATVTNSSIYTNQGYCFPATVLVFLPETVKDTRIYTNQGHCFSSDMFSFSRDSVSFSSDSVNFFQRQLTKSCFNKHAFNKKFIRSKISYILTKIVLET